MSKKQPNYNWKKQALEEGQRNNLLNKYAVYKADKDGKKTKDIVLPNLGQLIWSEYDYHFKTTKDNQQIYRYNGGYYTPDGEQIINNKVEEFLGEDCREHYKKEVVGWIRDKEPAVKRSIFDVAPHLINLRNGIYNIKTKKLIQHSSKYFFINEIPVKYKKKSDCPKIKQFLSEVNYEEDIPVVQEFMGYCLYRKYIIHKACMLVGGGRNGKSTLIYLLEHFLGSDNVESKELVTLLNYRFSMSDLYGKLLNAMAEISNQAINYSGIFKHLTGGDLVSGEVKHKGSIRFHNFAKFMFSCNELPKTEDKTYAYYFRWIILFFPNTFEKKTCDPNILEKLTTEEELSGLFNFAAEGLDRLLKQKDFSYSRSVDEVAEIYETMSDPVYAFCKEFVTNGVMGRHILKDDFYQEYVIWCKNRKIAITPKNMLSRELPKHLHDIRDGRIGSAGNQKRAYMNIDWKKDEHGNIMLPSKANNIPAITQSGIAPFASGSKQTINTSLKVETDPVGSIVERDAERV